MVSQRLRCACCALPARVLEHVARKAAPQHQARLARHQEESAEIRLQRHGPQDSARAARAGRGASAPAQGGLSVYDAGFTKTLPGRLVREAGTAASRDTTVNHAWDNVSITLQFFAEVFGRDSLDGKGMHVDASVHYGEQFSNAMWTGKEMLFGDGDGIHIMGFAQSLDIVAHELTHAVTQHTITGGLGQHRVGGKVVLAGQAGALNESLSDVFACMVKQWHRKESVSRADWLLGEGILAPGLGKAVRSLKDPGNPVHTYEDDDQARDMRGFVPGGDVHANSGIPNHAFYLAASALGGHSWEHAGHIWYEAIGHLGKNASFADAAQVTMQAADSLFGVASKEHKSVHKAWQQVRVVE